MTSGLLGLQEIRNRFAAASISPTGYGAAPFVSGGTSPRSKVPTLLPHLNHWPGSEDCPYSRKCILLKSGWIGGYSFLECFLLMRTFTRPHFHVCLFVGYNVSSCCSSLTITTRIASSTSRPTHHIHHYSCTWWTNWSHCGSWWQNHYWDSAGLICSLVLLDLRFTFWSLKLCFTADILLQTQCSY